MLFGIIALLIILSLLLFLVGMSLVRHPRNSFLDTEKAKPGTLAWWDASLGGWGLILLAILLAGCGLFLLLSV